MTDKNFCMSSYLAYRYVERPDVDFYEGMHHENIQPISEEKRVLVHTAEEIDRDIQKQFDELKAKGEVKGVGIGSKDWTVIRDLAREVPFDWVMFACAPTILRHPSELLSFIAELAEKGVTVIDSAVFNGGFLTGGDLLDYRPADPQADARLFAVRETYLKLCAKHALDPAAVAVEYALRVPGVKHVALNTSKPERVAVNAAYGTHCAPEAFWNELKEML